MKLRTPSPEIHAGIYRQFVTGKDLKRFWVSEEQSDLLISAHGVFVEVFTVPCSLWRWMSPPLP